MFVLSTDPHSLVEPVVGEDYNTLYLHLVGDKSRLPAYTGLPTNPLFQHGFRLYADGLEPSEKTALYILPSDFDQVISNYRYGFMYLPGIGVAEQAAYPANDTNVFNILCPDNSIIWAEGMPTSWSLYGEDGEMEHVGKLIFAFGIDTIGNKDAILKDYAHIAQNDSLFISWISPLENINGSMDVVCDGNKIGSAEYDLTNPNFFAIGLVQNLLYLFEYGFASGPTSEELYFSANFEVNLRQGQFPQFIFESMFVEQ